MVDTVITLKIRWNINQGVKLVASNHISSPERDINDFFYLLMSLHTLSITVLSLSADTTALTDTSTIHDFDSACVINSKTKAEYLLVKYE